VTGLSRRQPLHRLAIESPMAHEALCERRIARRLPVAIRCQWHAREFSETGVLAAI